jgi:hypothetical protein
MSSQMIDFLNSTRSPMVDLTLISSMLMAMPQVVQGFQPVPGQELADQVRPVAGLDL